MTAPPVPRPARRPGRPRRGRLGRRLVNLYLGLVLFGVSIALMVRANLGLAPWDVLHEGLANRTVFPLGTVVILVSVLVLLLWVPLRERPGIGTVSNVIVVGLVIDLTLLVLPEAQPLALQIGFLLGGVFLNGVATALYVGAGLGPGPRDGLMTGLAARGWSIRVARTSIEVTALLGGWLLGGTVGLGTVLYALAIGPLAHQLLPLLSVREEAATTTA